MAEYLKKIRKNIMIRAKNKILKKYGNSIRNYHRHKIFDLLFSRNTKFTINYKEKVIYDNFEEYNLRFYKRKISRVKFLKILKYYINYLTFFCRPMFTSFYYNDFLQNYFNIKADIFYRENYADKDEEEIFLKDMSNKDFEQASQNSKGYLQKNTNLIFDNETRKFLEASTNIITSIEGEKDLSIAESFKDKIDSKTNKHIAYKNTSEDYLFNLIEIIKSNKKEKKIKNKNLNINLNYSSSQDEKKFIKKNKKFKIYYSNKNITKNNYIFTNYNIINNIKTIIDKKNNNKEIYKGFNGINQNNKRNMSDTKIKNKNNSNNSLNKTDKSKKKKNKYTGNINGKNLNYLSKKIMKKISTKSNTNKSGTFILYKRSSLKLKCYNFKNNNCKIISYSIQKNNSTTNSNNNIYHKNYNSNSNSPIKNRNITKENKSDIFNFSKKSKPNRFEIKKISFNATNYLSSKKKLKKKIIKNVNNYIKNKSNNYSNNAHFLNNLNKSYKNKLLIALHKKISNNNSLSKKKKNKCKNIGKKNLLINYLSNYFNVKNPKIKSLKSISRIGNKQRENLQTFSMRNSKQNKSNPHLNKIYFNNNSSFNNIINMNSKIDINAYGYYTKSKNSFNKKKSFKIFNNSGIEKFQKKKNIPKVKLLNKKSSKIDKNKINLNSNINTIISSSNNNTQHSSIRNSYKIIDKICNSNHHSKNNNLNINNQKVIQKKEIITSNNNLSNKSRNKFVNKISKKKIEKLLCNLNYNVKYIQSQTKIDNSISNKINYLNYKNNILIRNKIKSSNNSFNKSGNSKIINLTNKINKNQSSKDKQIKIKDDSKKINSFVQNKKCKEINGYKKK